MLVEIVDSDPIWPCAFEALRDEIAATPGAIAIEHIGSRFVWLRLPQSRSNSAPPALAP